MKRVLIFGSTGSVGSQALEVLRRFPERFQVHALTALKNEELLREQAAEFGAQSHLGLLEPDTIRELVKNADMVLNAIPGFEGLSPALETVKAGKILLSANKESLAVAGRYLRQIAAETGAEILPLDSEASALFQLLNRYGRENTKAVTLTCSGGPFYGKKREDLEHVTVSEALAHPTWKMGPKISVDCATLVNKVLEVYEAHELFDIPLQNIHIVIHRQSVVHGILHTHTGASKMHIAARSMLLPIAAALFHPEPAPELLEPLQMKSSELHFDQPDPETFRPLLWLARHKGNPLFPLALNALNDLATREFLNGRIRFLEIFDFIESELEEWLYEIPPKNLEELIAFHHRLQSHYEHRFTPGSGKIPAGRSQ